ncbi:MAG TPA: hypothetical protein DDW76_15640 [Cyanobacteria bacterium UBA11369]|nr:hypothetical protein [Cyanobacteria bacterium UBA11371]HBE35186.1 hypothetical protein [Cyanobacteria bacterium UBA11368]HBE50182.1 hypothetical protein [Cyanobacteria bacterium UBA11369]
MKKNYPEKLSRKIIRPTDSHDICIICDCKQRVEFALIFLRKQMRSAAIVLISTRCDRNR